MSSATLRIYRRLREAGHDNVGAVLQSYLYRSEDDLAALLPLAPNLRLVKGAYLEPPEVAYPEKSDVDAAYVRLLETALTAGGFTAIATHDETLIEHAIAFTKEREIPTRATSVPDALRRAARAAARPRPPRLRRPRRDAVWPRLVSLSHEKARGAAGERALPPAQHHPRLKPR